MVVVAISQVSGPPRDLHDLTVPIPEAYPVVDPKRLFEPNHDSREEIGQDRLQRQTEDDRGHGAGAEDKTQVLTRVGCLQRRQDRDQVDGRHGKSMAVSGVVEVPGWR